VKALTLHAPWAHAAAAWEAFSEGLTEHHNLVLHAPTDKGLKPWSLVDAVTAARKAGNRGV